MNQIFRWLSRFRRLKNGLSVDYCLTQEREQLQEEFNQQVERVRSELDVERQEIKNEWAVIHKQRGQVELRLLDLAHLKRQLENQLAAIKAEGANEIPNQTETNPN